MSYFFLRLRVNRSFLVGLIDWTVFYAVLAIFQLVGNGKEREKKQNKVFLFIHVVE